MFFIVINFINEPKVFLIVFNFLSFQFEDYTFINIQKNDEKKWGSDKF
tara:strand:- start:2028 stop:2171 length:144 start_codon:yes stop_codon:yes gene_type:complete